jgi:predicted nucleic acid-binding protein
VVHYLDTSALVKLVVREKHSQALYEWVAGSGALAVSSDLARTELARAVRRAEPDLAVRARDVLSGLILIKLTTAHFEAAGRLDPTELRSLDALHLAVALDLGDDLEAVVAYDRRLIAAAEANGVRVLAPGLS